MQKWADYGITAVRRAPDGNRITELEVRQDNGDTVGAAAEWSRQRVVQAIDDGHRFVTAYRQNGSWTRGADVHISHVGYEQFLRTDSNKFHADNLGELPELPVRVARVTPCLSPMR